MLQEFNATLTATRLERGLTECDVELLAQKAKLLVLKRRAALYHQGDAAAMVYILNLGILKLTRAERDGKSTVLDVHTPPSLLGSYRANDVYFDTARAITDTVEVWAWDYEWLVTALPTTRVALLEQAAAQVRPLQLRLCEVMTQSVPTRLARFICRSDGYLTCSKEELAQLIGTTQYTISRLLSHWRKTGAVSSRRGSITVLDRTKLEEECA